MSECTTKQVSKHIDQKIAIDIATYLLTHITSNAYIDELRDMFLSIYMYI